MCILVGGCVHLGFFEGVGGNNFVAESKLVTISFSTVKISNQFKLQASY